MDLTVVEVAADMMEVVDMMEVEDMTMEDDIRKEISRWC
jgi:hypothetical protein